MQSIQWQGPEEWGAPADIGRRVLAEETRTIDIYPGEVANVIDIRSQLRPTDWDVTIGTTRHAYFTIRMADELRPANGGNLIDSEGRVGQQEVCNHLADWVDISGPAVGGQKAGITVIPHASATGIEWFCFDYGTMLVNPFMREKGILEQRRGTGSRHTNLGSRWGCNGSRRGRLICSVRTGREIVCRTCAVEQSLRFAPL